MHSDRIEAVCFAARDLWVRILLNADDHGTFDARPAVVASKCYPLQTVASNCAQLMDELERADLIRRYSISGKPYLYVSRWYERPRSKPKFPEPPQGLREKECDPPTASVCNCAQLQALHVHDHDHDHVHDHGHEEGSAGLRPPVPAKPLKNGRATPDTAPTWAAFTEAYLARYHTPPLRDATTNSQMARFVRRVGVEDAPAIAAFYVQHSKGYYVGRQHSVGILVSDAEALRTQWLSGRRVTDTQARQADRSASNPFAEMLNERDEA